MSMIFSALHTVVANAIALGMVIFLHEFGHYLACRKLGVRVERFAFGFGTELLGFTGREGTRFSLCAIPFGGFVKPAGEDPVEGGPEPKPDEYFGQSWNRRLIIVYAGPAMNYVLAFCLYTGLIWGRGLPEPTKAAVIGNIVIGFPADKAGIQIGDRVLSFDGRSLTKAEYRPVGPFGAMYEATRLCWLQTQQTVTTIAGKIWKRERPDLAGPVGIFQMVARAARSGWEDFIFLIGFISVAIGFFNLLPIPVLDGGHAVMYLWEGLSRRRLTQDLMTRANSVGFVLIALLIIFATYSDVVRLREESAARKAQAAQTVP